MFSEAKPTDVVANSSSSIDQDDAEIEQRFGTRNEFRREFGNLSTFSFAFSIMGMCSSIATTFNTPMLLGGPASVVWCWFMGSIFNLSLAASIAEIISAYPTCGGVYSASAWLVPKKYRAVVGWVTGWLNLLGQVAGVASTEWGLAVQIWSAVSLYRNGDFLVTPGMQYGLYVGLLVFHGLLNSLKTRDLAVFTKSFVFINIGATFIIIITLLATTGASNMNSAAYVFTFTDNQTGYSSNGLAFLFGLLSVQWTMTDYDAVAHISFEVRRAAIAAPVALFTAVIGTGAIGWLLNIVLVLCSPPIDQLPGVSGSAFLTIMATRMGNAGSIVLWVPVMMVAFFTVQTALQANARTVWAFSRDEAFPDRKFFGKMNRHTQTPINAVWLVVFLCALLGLLNFASPVAIFAIFSLCAVALDISYVIPVAAKVIFANHPEVMFKPGPFHLGKWGKTINCIMFAWTAFEVIILAFPTIQPLTADNMNYSSVICIGILVLSLIWYAASAHKRYTGPRSDTPAEIDGHHLPATETSSAGENDIEAEADSKKTGHHH